MTGRSPTYASQSAKDIPIGKILFPQMPWYATLEKPWILGKGKSKAGKLLQIIQMYLNVPANTKKGWGYGSPTMRFSGLQETC